MLIRLRLRRVKKFTLRGVNILSWWRGRLFLVREDVYCLFLTTRTGVLITPCLLFVCPSLTVYRSWAHTEPDLFKLPRLQAETGNEFTPRNGVTLCIKSVFAIDTQVGISPCFFGLSSSAASLSCSGQTGRSQTCRRSKRRRRTACAWNFLPEPKITPN